MDFSNLSSMDASARGSELFRHFPDIYYFAKDARGRFIAANPAFVEMAGQKSEADLLGKTDFDIWPRFLAEKYAEDDARVRASSAALVNKIELVIRSDRSTDWFATTKVPLAGPGGEIAGIEGVCRYLKKARAPIKGALEMSAAIDYIMENYHRKIDVPALAAMVSLSVKQFERKFKKEYGALPMKYIHRIRLDAACQLLAKTRLPIVKISKETGFYDGSHFSHLFVKSTGLSPKAYREKNYVPDAPKFRG